MRRPSTPTRRGRRPVAMAATALLATLPATAASAETLADAVATAYAGNPNLVQQRFRQRSTDEAYVQARAGYGPTLAGEVDTGVNQTTIAGREANGDSGTLRLTLSQPIYTAGRLRGTLAAASRTVEAGAERLRSVEQQLVQNVVAVYAAVLRDEARLAVGRENVAVLRDQLAEKLARARQRDLTLTDIGQADSRLAAGETQLAALEAQLAVSRGEYLQVVGQNPGTLAPLPDLGPLPASIDEAFGSAERDNPDLATARRIEEASSATAAAVRGERGPTVAVSAQAIYTNDAFRFAGQDARKQLTAGLTLTQPFFSSGAIRSRVRDADARNGVDQAGIDLARRAALQLVTRAWAQLAAARVALVSGQRQVDSAQLAFAGMRRESLEGLRSTLDVLNTEQELQAAQLALLQNRYQEFVSRAALLAAMGRLGAGALAPGIERYDPEDYYRAVRGRGWTPLVPVAQTIDRIGAADPRRPLSPALTGAAIGRPTGEQPLPATPGRDLTQAPLVPITQSRLVPAAELPDGVPRTGLTLDAPRPDTGAATQATTPAAASPAPPPPAVQPPRGK